MALAAITSNLLPQDGGTFRSFDVRRGVIRTVSNSLRRQDPMDFRLWLALFTALSFVGCGGGSGSSGGGGGTPPPSTTLTLNLAANQIVYDSSRQQLYASVGSGDASHPDTVAFIDPSSATVTSTIAVGKDPNRLALSQDGSYLYVGTDGTNSVQRINLASNTIDETIPMGSNTFSTSLIARDIQVMPGSSRTIAVVRAISNSTPSESTDVAIYDDTTMRPNTTLPSSLLGVIISVTAFASSGSTLYGLDNEESSFSFTRMSIDPNGVYVQDTNRFLLGDGYNATMVYDSGLIYSTFGTVANPSTLALQGKFPANPPSLQIGQASFAENVLVDNGIPYLLTHDPGNGPVITAYDPHTYLKTASSAINIPSSDSETSLVQCGSSCFAFIDYAGLPNITTAIVISTTPLIPVATTAPTLGNLTPNHILWNPATQRLYASIPGEAGPWGNSVAVINPSTQAIESTIFVGSDPDVLALSADGAFLYVGLDGSASVARVNLATSAVDLTFFLGLDPILGGPTFPVSISVSPSDSTTVAVARINPVIQPKNEIVAIYQQGVMLPNTTNDGDTVAFCNSGSVLYGFGFAFFAMSVDGTGVQQTGAVSGLIGGAIGPNIVCDANVIYASTGYAVNPLTSTQLGIFSGLMRPAAVAVDDPNQKVFFLDNDSGTAVSIVGFDQNSYSPTGVLPAGGAINPGHDLVRWGTNGFAVATQNQVVLVTGTLP